MFTPARSRIASRRSIVVAALLAGLAPAAHALPAFSGAEGPGADATGGRNGDVYHVTNLLDDHDGTIAGSLRYGLVNAPAAGRTIVFDVGGTIRLTPDPHNSTHTWLRSGKANITIAGQTAPGEGITIIGQGATLSGDNWILRNLKFRPGQDHRRPGILTNDGISNKLQNSIIDHVSISWADDEALSSTDAVRNTTVQYSILGEGLNYTLADGSKHAFGALISSEVNDAKLSYHHNLFVHLSTRNPRLGSENGTGAILNFSNNVVYNWSGRAGYSINLKPSRTNYLGNYYVAGPNTIATDRVFYSPDTATRIYHGSTNLVDMDKDGVLDGGAFNFTGPQFQGTYTQESSPFDVASGYVQSAADAAPQVLDHAGANWWDRDPIDARQVRDVRNGTGAIINYINDAPKDPSYQYDATGFPIYPEVHRPADFDTDLDGMADAWERAHDLDPSTATDRTGDFDADGYTNLEEYINDLAAFPAPVAIRWQGDSGRYAEISNWGVSQTIPANTVTHWQPSRYDAAHIDSGVVTVDSVGQHARRLAIASGAADAASLRVTDGWLNVADLIEIGGTATSAGTLVLSGGELTASIITKGAAGAFEFTGGVLHAGVVAFDLENQGGTLAPGNSIGHTHVQGDLTLSSGVLEIELTSGGSDTVLVDGLLTLGGELQVVLLDGLTPSLGDRWTFAAADEIGGAFIDITDGFELQRDGDLLVLVAVPEPSIASLITAGVGVIALRRRTH